MLSHFPTFSLFCHEADLLYFTLGNVGLTVAAIRERKDGFFGLNQIGCFPKRAMEEAHLVNLSCFKSYILALVFFKRSVYLSYEIVIHKYYLTR